MSEGRQQIPEDDSSVDVVLVDDHPMLAAGLVSGLEARGLTLRTAPRLEVGAVLDLVDSARPRLVLLDHQVPPIGTTEVLFEPLTARGVPFAMLTGQTGDALWGRLLECGARGVIGKGLPLGQVLDGIEALVTGGQYRPSEMARCREAWRVESSALEQRLAPFRALTARERAVLGALVAGDGPADIAERDFVAVSTVRSQLKSLYRKLDVRSQIEAVALAREANWTESAVMD